MTFGELYTIIKSDPGIYPDRIPERNRNKMKKLKLLALIMIIPILLISCAVVPGGNTDSGITTIPTSTTRKAETTAASTTTVTTAVTTVPVTPEPTVPDPVEITLLAVGDNLIHGPLIRCGQNAGFDTLYKELTPMISAADLAIINQETIFTYNEKNYSGYPRFGSPTAVGEAALKAGFDVFSTATNHTADQGEQAIFDTLDFWSKHPEGTALGIYKGTLKCGQEESDSHKHTAKCYKKGADSDEIPVITVKGVRIAFLNYTYGMNRSLTNWWMVDVMQNNDASKAAIAERIEKAKEISDFVVMCAHWGSEYVNTPTSSEVMWAQFFADCGVDLVIGTHPHVVQPVMEVEGKNGNKTVVYYSLGNFVHNQNDFAPNIGGLANITLISDENGVRIKEYNMVGTMVDCYKNEDGVQCYTACLISEMTPERLKKHVKFSKKTVEDFENEFLKASTSYPKTAKEAA